MFRLEITHGDRVYESFHIMQAHRSLEYIGRGEGRKKITVWSGQADRQGMVIVGNRGRREFISGTIRLSLPSLTNTPPYPACSLGGHVSLQHLLPLPHCPHCPCPTSQICMLWEGDDCITKERTVSNSSAVGFVSKNWCKKSRKSYYASQREKSLQGRAKGPAGSRRWGSASKDGKIYRYPSRGNKKLQTHPHTYILCVS